MRKVKDPDLPEARRESLDRLGRRALAAVSRYAAARLGAMGGAEGGKKQWVGTTRGAPGSRTQGGHGALGKSERTAVRCLTLDFRFGRCRNP